MKEVVIMMKDSIYQEIYDELEKYLPDKCDNLIVYIEYGDNSYNMSFYIKVDGKTIKCYDLPNVDTSTLLESFSKIDKLVGPEREVESDKWTNMTLVITGEDFKAYFDYTDLTKGSFAYKKAWKQKYL